MNTSLEVLVIMLLINLLCKSDDRPKPSNFFTYWLKCATLERCCYLLGSLIYMVL